MLDRRQSDSPRAMPPTLVAIQSFIEAWWVSQKYSHMKLPENVASPDSQKS